MSFVGIQATVDFYTAQEANLTNDLSDIMNNITLATKKSSELSQSVSSEREAVKSQYTVDDPEYKSSMDDIEDQYQLKLSEIQSWESELETQKETKETELQATTSYEESYKSALKSNIKNDFTYGNLPS